MACLAGFTVPKEDRYFEDYQEGFVYEFPETVHVTEADIIRFAREFDPQYFHVDSAAAGRSMYKGLIASGGHTMSLAFRLTVDNYLPGKASLGSPGIDEVRWLRPVRPDDTLRLRITTLEARVSSSRNDRGYVRSLVETVNQNGDVVMKYIATNIIAKQP